MTKSAAVPALAAALGFAAAGACAPAGGEMVLVSGGEFVMGDAAGRPNETPHPVKISPFYLDKCPVTQEIYEKVMRSNPSKRKGGKNPVEQVQWTDAARFCNWCSALEGLTPCYDPKTWKCDFEANGYRLPTEAEWEYACRAGSRTKYCFGDAASELSRYAWFKDNSGGSTHPVGQKTANAWGLFDMHGNVWEWCNDFYREDYYARSPVQDPRGPETGKTRVLRGGAWDSGAEKCRSAYRFKEFPTVTDACFGYDSYGFRRARNGVTAVASTGRSARLRGTIVFVSNRGGALDIWKMRASGANPVNLTGDPDPDADPRFSPDGKMLLFCRAPTTEGPWQIWVMDLGGDDRGAVRLTSKGSNYLPDWDPREEE